MKRIIILCTWYIVTLSFLTACQKQPTPREQLLNRLTDLQQRGCMFGHQDDPFYGIGWAYEEGRSDVLETCGDWPAVMGFDLGGIEMSDDKNLDSVPFDCIRDEIIRHYQRGGIVTISWHPRNPLTALDHPNTWPEGSAWEATDGAVAAILADGPTHELFLEWLRRVRSFLLTLRTEDGKPVPFIFRPWHENNGAWFWWGDTHCTPDEYKALYTMTQDYISSVYSVLSISVVWSYSPNLDGAMDEEKFLQWYPGDDRIDLIGLDAYQWGTEEDFVRQTTADLDFLCTFAAEHHKLVALTECGFRSIPDPTWWHRVLLPIIKSYSGAVLQCNGPTAERSNSPKGGLSYALVWRNAEGGEHFGPVPDTDNGREFMQFYHDPQILFLKDITNP